MENKTKYETNNLQSHSKNFIKKGLIVAVTSAAGLSLLSGCKHNEEKEEYKGQKVSPPEDLMQ